MAISVFPAGGGEFVTNDFVVDMNDTSNNVIDLGRSYAEGAYEISLATGDTSFDIYAVDADGNSVGYTNDATLVCSAGFTQLAILGVSQTERLTFAFSGASNDATAEGTATGGGAYLENATPTDLPNQDDTTTVTGGNFASDVQIFFESGATSTAAKNITRNDSTELIVTRPDALDPDLDPWTLRAVNPGVPEPTGTDANILTDIVDAGATPVWVTTSPLTNATFGQAYTETLEATDADGSVAYQVTSGSLPTGLSLDSPTGVISGTPTGSSETFTITVTDEGGNANSRQFTITVIKASGGTITQASGFTIHTFEASDDFEVFAELTDVEYIVVAGGGGGGQTEGSHRSGGGGAGGYRSSVDGESSGGGASAESKLTLSADTYSITVGAGGLGTGGGGGATNGTNSSLGSLVTCIGGGAGAGKNADTGANVAAKDGGSGGGAFSDATTPGSGTINQGFDGGGFDGSTGHTGSGGGAGATGGFQTTTTTGVTSNITGTAVEYAQGGGGAVGGDNGDTATTPGSGGGASQFANNNPEDGKDGIVIVRYVS